MEKYFIERFLYIVYSAQREGLLSEAAPEECMVRADVLHVYTKLHKRISVSFPHTKDFIDIFNSKDNNVKENLLHL